MTNYTAQKMSALDIVEIQLKDLHNDKDDSGIVTAYFFASPANKQNTGPLFNFKRMVKNDVYKHLINHKSYSTVVL